MEGTSTRTATEAPMDTDYPATMDTDVAPLGDDQYITATDAYLQRLRRIEGQARDLQHMVEDEEQGIDILPQVAAMTRALQSFALALLDDHLRHCVLAAADTADSQRRHTKRPRRLHDSYALLGQDRALRCLAPIYRSRVSVAVRARDTHG